MPIPCYGCGVTLRVERRWPEQGLLVAGWTLTSGETYCPACATARGFPDPRGFDPAAQPLPLPAGGERESTVPSGIAIADTATTTALKRYLHGALASILAGTLAVVAVIVIVSLHTAHLRHLYDSGVHTTGVIADMQPCGCGGATGVRYVAGGITRYGVETLPGSGPGYYLGEPVDVSYDRQDPSRLHSPDISIPRSWARSLSLAGMSGLVLLIGGLAAARRASRWRVLLAGSAWRPYRLTYIPRTRRLRYPGLVLTPNDATGAPLVLRLGAVFKWRATMVKAANGRTVWLAGDPGSQGILAVHPGLGLFPTRPVRSSQLERYAAAAGKARAAEALGPSERRAAIQQAHRKFLLRALVVWAILLIVAITHPTTLGWLLLLAESLIWGLAVLRSKLAHDRVLADAEAGSAPRV
jgi:hypothetical protein